MIVLESKIKAKQNLIETVLVDELIMVDVEDGKYYALKGTAVVIWSKIQHEIGVKTLIDSLISEYDDQEGLLKEDVLKYLNDLYDKGLVKIQ
jgi:hypothetical protein